MVVPKLFDLTLVGGSMGGGGAGTGGRARPRGWVGELLASGLFCAIFTKYFCSVVHIYSFSLQVLRFSPDGE